MHHIISEAFVNIILKAEVLWNLQRPLGFYAYPLILYLWTVNLLTKYWVSCCRGFIKGMDGETPIDGHWDTFFGIQWRTYMIKSWYEFRQTSLMSQLLKKPTQENTRHRFNPRVGKILWRRKWQPTPLFLPGKSHGQRSMAG